MTDKMCTVMRCARPSKTLTQEFPCGNCLACRINKKRQLTARLILETMVSGRPKFVTLTYDEWSVPNDFGLCPRDLTLFLKRLRKARNGLRYFAVGEYGEKSGRPHYHLLIWKDPFLSESVVLRNWQKGLVEVETDKGDSASYVSGYVTKKLTDPSHRFLQGRHPEFTRRSKHPALGVPAVPALCKGFEVQKREWVDTWEKDFEFTFRYMGKEWPLDRLMKEKVLEYLGAERLQANRPPRERGDFERFTPEAELRQRQYEELRLIRKMESKAYEAKI